MLRETHEAAAACRRQFARNAASMRDVAARLRQHDPCFAATVARGSSREAAGFAKLLFETRLALPTLHHAPSVATQYDATSPRLARAVVVAISQSGRSPDLLRAAEDAQRVGAPVVALVNDEASPLASLADIVVPLCAGPERSVAATKSFIAALAAVAHLVAEWAGDAALLAAVERLGDTLDAAGAISWSAALAPLGAAAGLLVLGRGPTLAIAGEAALKLKETSAMHAGAFSTAEVAHGPMTLVGAGDPVLVFGPLDAARAGLAERIAMFEARGARVIASGDPADVVGASVVLPMPAGLHPVAAAIAQIRSFYPLAERLARARGRDPDQPPFLQKVTRTL